MTPFLLCLFWSVINKINVLLVTSMILLLLALKFTAQQSDKDAYVFANTPKWRGTAGTRRWEV